MKRFALFLPVVLLCGCAQLFNGNVFSSVDAPPALNVAALAAKSPTDLETMIKNDPSFLKALQNDPVALKAVHTVLSAAYASPSGTDSASTKASVVSAAQADITALTFGTGAGGVVNQAIKQAGNLTSGGSVATAVSSLFAGQSQADIAKSLTNFLAISSAFSAMQTEAATGSGTTIDSSTFFGTANKGDLAQTALVAAAVKALVTDNPGGTDGLAAQLAAGTTPTSGASISSLSSALSSTGTTTSNPYAYVSASMSFIPH